MDQWVHTLHELNVHDGTVCSSCSCAWWHNVHTVADLDLPHVLTERLCTRICYRTEAAMT